MGYREGCEGEMIAVRDKRIADLNDAVEDVAQRLTNAHARLNAERKRVSELEEALTTIVGTAVPVLTGGNQSRALSEIFHLAQGALQRDSKSD